MWSGVLDFSVNFCSNGPKLNIKAPRGLRRGIRTSNPVSFTPALGSDWPRWQLSVTFGSGLLIPFCSEPIRHSSARLSGHAGAHLHVMRKVIGSSPTGSPSGVSPASKWEFL
ncbi:unnamed protein product [Merluccius merluccius]